MENREKTYKIPVPDAGVRSAQPAAQSTRMKISLRAGLRRGSPRDTTRGETLARPPISFLKLGF